MNQFVRYTCFIFTFYVLRQIAGGHPYIFMLPNFPYTKDYIISLTVLPRNGSFADVRIDDLMLNQTLTECNVTEYDSFLLGNTNCSLPTNRTGLALISNTDISVIARWGNNSFQLPEINEMNRYDEFTSGTQREKEESLQHYFVYPSRQNMTIELCTSIAQQDTGVTISTSAHDISNCSSKALNDYEGVLLDLENDLQFMNISANYSFAVIEFHYERNTSNVFNVANISFPNVSDGIEKASKSNKNIHEDSIVKLLIYNITEPLFKNFTLHNSTDLDFGNAENTTISYDNTTEENNPLSSSKAKGGNHNSVSLLLSTTDNSNVKTFLNNSSVTDSPVFNRDVPEVFVSDEATLSNVSISDNTSIAMVNRTPESTPVSTDNDAPQTTDTSYTGYKENKRPSKRYKTVVEFAELEDRKNLLAIVISLCSAVVAVVLVIVMCLIVDMFSRRKQMGNTRIRPYMQVPSHP